MSGKRNGGFCQTLWNDKRLPFTRLDPILLYPTLILGILPLLNTTNSPLNASEVLRFHFNLHFERWRRLGEPSWTGLNWMYRRAPRAKRVLRVVVGLKILYIFCARENYARTIAVDYERISLDGSMDSPSDFVKKLDGNFEKLFAFFPPEKVVFSHHILRWWKIPFDRSIDGLILLSFSIEKIEVLKKYTYIQSVIWLQKCSWNFMIEIFSAMLDSIFLNYALMLNFNGKFYRRICLFHN